MGLTAPAPTLAARGETFAPLERPWSWIMLTDGQGRLGIGESSPLGPFSGEGSGACDRAIRGVAALALAIDDAGPAAALIDRVVRRAGPAVTEAKAARFAVETALADLLGQRRGCSVAELLGGPRPYDEVAVNGLLFATEAFGVGGAPPRTRDPDALAEAAAALAASGIRAIKIKLRARDEAGFQRELSALRAVRERLPLPFELRLDPNAAWTVEEARRRMERLAPVAPRYVEQPVAGARLLALGAVALPWAADEALADPELIDALLDAEGCAAFVIKPHVLGLLRARELAVRAQQKGIDVVITHLFDGPVAMAAAAELALSLPRAPLAVGLDLHPGLARWPDIAIPQLARRGLVVPSGASGLGLRLPDACRAWLDPASVER